MVAPFVRLPVMEPVAEMTHKPLAATYRPSVRLAPRARGDARVGFRSRVVLAGHGLSITVAVSSAN